MKGEEGEALTSPSKYTSHTVDHSAFIGHKHRYYVFVLTLWEHLGLVHIHIVPSRLQYKGASLSAKQGVHRIESCLLIYLLVNPFRHSYLQQLQAGLPKAGYEVQSCKAYDKG